MELLRIIRQMHCKAVEQRATLIHRQYNRDWGTSYSRPPIDPYLTSPPVTKSWRRHWGEGWGTGAVLIAAIARAIYRRPLHIRGFRRTALNSAEPIGPTANGADDSTETVAGTSKSRRSLYAAAGNEADVSFYDTIRYEMLF